MPIHVTERAVASVLTPQRGSFLTSGPYPFTHTLSPYTGCGFGRSACGAYCYAPFMPNWAFHATDAAWGDAVSVKANTAAVLSATLGAMPAAKRAALRVFMASTTDPYQPLDARHRITQGCLEAFADDDDLDLLVMQTRSPLITRDVVLLARIQYVWASLTVETDDEAYLRGLGGGPQIARRLQAAHMLVQAGVNTQITVSPCLPYTDADTFADALVDTGAHRFVVDTFVDGDGSQGRRTANTRYAQTAPDGWRATDHAQALAGALRARGVTVGWSAQGFCGIPPRRQSALL